jgi:hypothetical protein
MKNHITQFSLVIIAFVSLTLLLSYARPSADEPKQYIVVTAGSPTGKTDKFVAEVNQKLAEGWHLQGGVAIQQGELLQAMSK